MQKFSFAVILVLIGIIGFMKYCSKQDPPTGTTVIKTVTIPGDRIPYPVNVYLPSPRDSFMVRDTLWKSFPVDTAEILERFFTRYLYRDTIRDTSFIAILQEIITQNKIVNRTLWVQNTRPQAITYITTNIAPAACKWFIGPSISYNGKLGLGVGGIWCNGAHAFGVNYDVTNRISSLSYYYALKPK